MKRSAAAERSSVNRKRTTSDSSKLISLLALATGALAMPQTGKADIIYKDLSSQPVDVGFSAGSTNAFAFSDLPGAVQFGFNTKVYTFYLGSVKRYIRGVKAGLLGGTAQAIVQGYSVSGDRSVAKKQYDGAPWNSNLVQYSNVFVGVATTNAHTPGNYDHMYLGFIFVDTTQGGTPLYGWIEVSLANSNYPGGPTATIYGYAYENNPDLKIVMGAKPVPEPAPLGILALGALALGAKGVRAWRRDRSKVGKV